MEFGKEVGTWNFWVRIDWQTLVVVCLGLVTWTAIDYWEEWMLQGRGNEQHVDTGYVSAGVEWSGKADRV